MSCSKEARKRSVTISFWVTSAQAQKIDEMVAISGLSKQDYLMLRALDEEVVIVPSSRVVMQLKTYSNRIAEKLEVLSSGKEVSQFLIDQIHWLSTIMAAFAKYGESNFDAVQKIVDLRRE